MALGLRKLSQRLLAVALAIIAIALFALIFAPNQTVLLLSKPLLASTDLTLQELQGLEINFQEVSFERMSILVEDNSAILTGTRIGFQVTELISGGLDYITVEDAVLQIAESKSEAPSNAPPVEGQQLAELLAELHAELLTQASSLPFKKLELNSVQFTLDQYAINASLSVAAQPLVLQFDATAKAMELFSLSGTFSQISEQKIEGSLQLRENGEEILSTDMELAITDTEVELTAQSQAQMPSLINNMQRYLPNNGISNTSDFLSFSLQLSNDQTTPNVIGFELTSTEQAPVIELTQQIAGAKIETSVELQVPMLIPLTGSYDLNTQHLQLTLSDFESTLIGDSSAGLVTADMFFKQNTASCMPLSNCQIQTAFNTVSDVAFGTQDKYENISAGGSINLSWTDSVLGMTSDVVALSLPSITSGDFKGSAEIEITNINLEQDLTRQTSIASADYLADQISLENSIAAIDDLSMSGALSLARNTLETTTRFSLANQLTANAKLAHDLASGQGRAEVALNDYSFSGITPLSNLLSLKDYDVEFITGTLSGYSEFQWQQSTQGELAIEGPVNILLTDISGYYDDLFFVGLTTAIDGEFIDSTIFRSARPLQGEINTLDIGIPVSDISWGYSWEYSLDTENEYSVMTLENLTAEILGGEVSVPTLSMDSRNPQSQSNVVISNLNLETIVALAEYPGLYVDGFISGYLPIAITDSSITLNDGLISALNPGGTISYTPANSSAAINPSLQLVNDALSDYRYDRLNTNVFYTENGDLTLAVQLQGFNPDMNQGQAINLNVNVTDNIPTLLESLQASRSITDALEETLNNR